MFTAVKAFFISSGKIVLSGAIFSMLYPTFSQEIISDFDGNTYATVKVGTQLWMTENLKSKHDAKGQVIKRVCYHWQIENCNKYGGLYAWDDLNIDEFKGNLQGICPDGWHVPSDEEFTQMIDAIGGADSAALILHAAEELNFNLQYGGNYHNRLENFNFLDSIAYYWTSSSFSKTASWMRMFGKNYVNSNRSTVPNLYALSVRCIKD